MDMPEEPLFDGARRLDGQRESERAGVIGDLRLVRAHVDHRDEVLVRVEHRRAAAAERRVPRPEVVAAMNRDGRLFSDTRADAVGALDAFRPDAALPDATPSAAVNRSAYPTLPTAAKSRSFSSAAIPISSSTGARLALSSCAVRIHGASPLACAMR